MAGGPCGRDNFANIAKMCFVSRMDVLPPAPPAYEQIIKQKLVECGLSPVSVTVSYQDDLQGYEIVIGPDAGASSNLFSCIQAGSANEIVTFTDPATQRQYLAFVAEQYRPMVLAQAKQELSRRGRLVGFPSRASFDSDKLFLEAVEQHCGLAKGSAIRQFGAGFAFQPPPDETGEFSAFSEKYGCLLAAIQFVTAQGELEIGLIGNEASAMPK